MRVNAKALERGYIFMSMVYVISQDGQPLMPTANGGKVRVLLKEKKAKVIKACPFTIQLLYKTTSYTQPLILGVDAGSKKVGLSVRTDEKEVYAGEVELRNDIVKLLSEKRQYRRSRRNRLRYRAPRFDNRNRTEGWLAPSIRNKVEAHLRVVEDLHKILPITSIRAEVASFDIQKIQAILEGKEVPEGKGYQEGVQLGFWNIREYVFFRDNHECQHCHGKSKDKILNVHHIESRQTGGDRPDNLVTLCETCHKLYHAGKITLHLKKKYGFRDAAFMGIMRWAFYNELKERYPDVALTYGYITKNTRIQAGLPKEHYIDALCITGKPDVERCEEYYYIKQTRRHNRQIHKANLLKGGRKKLNQAPFQVKGYRLFDRVKVGNQVGFIFGRRSTGYFDIRKLDGTRIHAGISYKKIQLIETRKRYLVERRFKEAA